MKKLIGRLLAIVLIAALAVCGIVTYNGYRLYKEVTEAVPVSEKVAEIEEQAHYTTYESLPKRYVEAVIAAEDRRFFRHHGFDILATGRAMWHNIEAGRLIEGGSTHTQGRGGLCRAGAGRSLRQKDPVRAVCQFDLLRVGLLQYL